MSKKLAGKAGKKLFEKHLEKYTPADPLYEFYTDSQGKKRRRERDLPPGLSQRDAKILKQVKKRAHHLDKGFRILGFRFGWTFIIGIIPGAGGVADAVLNHVLIIRKCRQAEMPSWLENRMLLNNAFSAIAGLIPLLGDVIVAAFKANSRNAALLEEFLRVRGDEYLKLRAEGKDVAPVAQGKGKAKAKVRQLLHKGDTIPPSDVQQVKPGAGLKADEVVPVPKLAPSPDAAASTSARGSPSRNTTKKLSILNGWRRKGGGTPNGEASAARRDSKFIENFDNENDNPGQSAVASGSK